MGVYLLALENFKISMTISHCGGDKNSLKSRDKTETSSDSWAVCVKAVQFITHGFLMHCLTYHYLQKCTKEKVIERKWLRLHLHADSLVPQHFDVIPLEQLIQVGCVAQSVVGKLNKFGWIHLGMRGIKTWTQLSITYQTIAWRYYRYCSISFVTEK